ncbi:hypothetical protein POUND7_002458 [Theobroma cacao]
MRCGCGMSTIRIFRYLLLANLHLVLPPLEFYVLKLKPAFTYLYFLGHNKEVLSICWDPSGNYIASISEDSARLWSMIDGECIHELCSTGNKFQSCTFHPVYSLLLVIGGYQTEMVASASHDQCVKLWK